MILPPAQQGSSAVVTSLVQSVIDDIDKRRQENEEKLKGDKKEDKVLKAWTGPSDVAATANAKINAHFFDSPEKELTMATLIARFSAAIGLSQAAEESNTDFAARLRDALAFTDLVSESEAFDKSSVITLARFGLTGDDISAVLNGTAENPSDMAERIARFATSQGIERNADESAVDFSARIGEALKQARKSLPHSASAVENRSGLTELGITANEMIDAIARPYGEAARAIQVLLAEKASEQKTGSDDMKKILQRLEQVANPKTLEELKTDRLKDDPTRVEDAETRREREEDIRALEAAEDLEDVEKLQELVKTANEAAAGSDPRKPGKAVDTEAEISVATIQVLAAGAETIEIASAATNDEQDGTTATGAPATETSSTVDDESKMSAEDQAVMLAKAGPPQGASAGQSSIDKILSIQVDENGIYDYLLRQKEAA